MSLIKNSECINIDIFSQERLWAVGDEAVAGHDRQAAAGRRRLAQTQARRLRRRVYIAF